MQNQLSNIKSIYIDSSDGIFATLSISSPEEKEMSSILNHLYILFCFFDESVRHTWEFKNHRTDGKVYLFNRNSQRIAIGLVPKLCRNIKETFPKYKIKLSDRFRNYFNPPGGKKISEEEFNEFVYRLDIHNKKTGEKLVPYDYQMKMLSESINYRRVSLMACTGCHSKGTEVIMYDGSLKKVEDISVGDKLMGPDNTSRTVMKLYSGVDELYKIKVNKRSEPYIVNKDHILHLQSTIRNDIDKVVNISVKDYLERGARFKHVYKFVYNNKEIEFNYNKKNPTKLSPYFVGLYLGDGHTHYVAITTMDKEIVDCIYEQIKYYSNIKIRISNNGSNANSYYMSNIICGKRKNDIMEDFSKIGIIINKRKDRTSCDKKFIPNVFKYGTVQDRYDILAGIIDTDGHLNGSYYEITSKSKQLIDDISFVACSLGFYTNIKIKYNKKYNKSYYKCYISGDIHKIPVRLQRKKDYTIDFKNRQKYHNLHGFSVESIGLGNYYGFQLDGDHLYLLKDFLITHNSGKSLAQYMITRWLYDVEKKDVLIIVPSQGLVEQLYSDFEKDYGWYDISNHCSMLHGDVKELKLSAKKKRALQELNLTKDSLLKNIVISTWQSLQKKEKDFFSRFQAIIVDEAHGAKADVIQKILYFSNNASVKIGLSGTLPETGLDGCLIEGALGERKEIIRSKELIRRGILTPTEIVAVKLIYEDSIKKQLCRHDFDSQVSLTSYNGSKIKTLELLIDSGKIPDTQNTIILFKYTDTLKEMKEYIEKKYSNFKCIIYDGSVKVEIREKIRGELEGSSGNLIFATYGTMKQGINVKRIHNIMFAECSKSLVMVVQSIGRGIRKYLDKVKLTIFDIVDDASYWTTPRTGNKSKLMLNYSMDHYDKRKVIYADEEFPLVEVVAPFKCNINLEEATKRREEKKAKNKKNKKTTESLTDRASRTFKESKARFFG